MNKFSRVLAGQWVSRLCTQPSATRAWWGLRLPRAMVSVGPIVVVATPSMRETRPLWAHLSRQPPLPTQPYLQPFTKFGKPRMLSTSSGDAQPKDRLWKLLLAIGRPLGYWETRVILAVFMAYGVFLYRKEDNPSNHIMHLVKQARDDEIAGDRNSAWAMYRRAIAATKAERGVAHESLFNLHFLNGRNLELMEKYDKAYYNYEQALLIAEQSFGERSVQAATAFESMGNVAMIQGKEELAMEHMKNCLILLHENNGNRNEQFLAALSQLAWIYAAQKRWDLAFELFSYVKTTAVAEYGLNSDPAVASQKNLDSFHAELRREDAVVQGNTMARLEEDGLPKLE